MTTFTVVVVVVIDDAILSRERHRVVERIHNGLAEGALNGKVAEQRL